MPRTGALSGLQALCTAAVQLAHVDGATVSIFTPGGARARVTASELWAAHLDELQFTVGEGPCFEAFARGEPVEVPDLGDLREGSPAARFPTFAGRAVEVGARWMLAVPVRSGDVTIGVFDLAARTTSVRSADVARVTALVVPLVAQGLTDLGVTGSDASLPDAAVEDFAGELASYRWVVHQAVGYLHARDGVGTGAALAQLRATAFATDVSLELAAEDVLAGRDQTSEEDR